MPIPVIKFRCQFKCRARAIDSKKKMEGHEQVCYKNPDNKTCATCSNQIYSSDYYENTKVFYRGCKIERMNSFIDELHDKLKVDSSNHIRPLFHCPNWNQEREQLGTGWYLNEIRPKIELAAMRRELAKQSITDLPF